MRYVVEYGTGDDRLSILEELSFIPRLGSALRPAPRIAGMIVPWDFDGTISGLCRAGHFRSPGGHAVLGMNVKTRDGAWLVFSPLLYNTPLDRLSRYQVYVHEYAHAHNAARFPSLGGVDFVDKILLSNLYHLYDEYCADRMAFDRVAETFPHEDHEYRLQNDRFVEGFCCNALKQEAHFYDRILCDIAAYRRDGDMNAFLGKTRSYFDVLSQNIVHAFAFIDHFPRYHGYRDLFEGSHFVNGRALRLLDFFRSKYLDGAVDLSDGKSKIADFIKNFGIAFTRGSGGVECSAVDIQL